MSTTLSTETKKIPGGLSLGFGRDPFSGLNKAVKKYGDICYISVGRYKFYLINNPDYINDLYFLNHKKVVKGPQMQRAKKVLGEGLLSSEGDFHHRQRRLIQPAFHHQRIVSYAKIMSAYIESMSNRWENGEVLDVHEEMTSLATRIVAKCLFDADVESEAKEVGKALDETLDYWNRLSSPIAVILDKLPIPGKRKYPAAVEKLDNVVYKMIKEKRRTGQDNGDLLSTLLKSEDAESAGRMTDKQVRDETMTLFLAGLDTTSNALTWAWYLLSQNPKVERKLHEEVDRLFPDHRFASAEDYRNLVYTSKVFKETLRLYPPVWVLGRTGIEDIIIDGYRLPSHSFFMLSQYVMHHDSRYFKDPEGFDPDRWTQEMQDNLPKFAYFPFGGGPRGCVGEPFAWMEGILVLASIARRWKLTHEPGHKVEMLPRTTLSPKYGMRMKILKR